MNKLARQHATQNQDSAPRLNGFRFCILCGVAAALIALLLGMSSNAHAADMPKRFAGDAAGQL